MKPRPCPYCHPDHEPAASFSWGAHVDGRDLDGHGRPVRLIVQPTAGHHVAQSDADWVFMILREWGPMMDLLEAAWGVIANSTHEWQEGGEWKQAAERWRDKYHEILSKDCEHR